MRRNRGFTLIETTVAIALLAVIIVTILGAFSAITIAARRHQQETTLDLVTRQDAEYIKSQAYSSTPPAAPYANIVVAGYSFSYQTLYFDPASNTFAAGTADNGLQELVLTVTGPNSANETLDFLKVQP